MTEHNRTYQGANSCDDIIGLMGAYSIGATTPEETRAVEALLPYCPQAMAELADYMAVSDAMLHVLPMDKEPPADLLNGLNLTDPTALHHASAHSNGVHVEEHTP
ncbi:MAG: hypothetical protein AAF653_17025, partial [Chloroflexota bacterium]